MVIVPIFAGLVTTLFEVALGVTALFLILLVLVQRGRGGGLAGALGGMGGSSAFGAKAGDIFTKITVVVAAFWIILCIAATKFSTPTSSRLDIGGTGTTSEAMTSLNPDSDPANETSEPPSGSAPSTGATDASGSSAANDGNNAPVANSSSDSNGASTGEGQPE